MTEVNNNEHALALPSSSFIFLHFVLNIIQTDLP